MAQSFQFYIISKTTEQWALPENANKTLGNGEIVMDSTQRRLKVGNGTSTYANTPFADKDIVDNLTSDDSDKSLSARQGKILKTLFDNLSESIESLTNIDAGEIV